MTRESRDKFIAYGPCRSYGIGYTVEEALGYCRSAVPGKTEDAKANVWRVDEKAQVNPMGDIVTPEGGRKPEKVGRYKL